MSVPPFLHCGQMLCTYKSKFSKSGRKSQSLSQLGKPKAQNSFKKVMKDFGCLKLGQNTGKYYACVSWNPSDAIFAVSKTAKAMVVVLAILMPVYGTCFGHQLVPLCDYRSSCSCVDLEIQQTYT